jgi:uncharacterized membrane protein
MLANPLHPAVVHFPIVLMFLAPLVAVGAMWAIARGGHLRRAWAIPVALCAALSVSAFVAVRTGEAQTERVERVVAEQPLETHEEGAEVFLMSAAVLTVISAAGLIQGRLGRTARWGTTVGAILLAVMGVRVGHSGGELVYRHGAASAYATAAVSAESAGSVEREHRSR